MKEIVAFDSEIWRNCQILWDVVWVRYAIFSPSAAGEWPPIWEHILVMNISNPKPSYPSKKGSGSTFSSTILSLNMLFKWIVLFQYFVFLFNWLPSCFSSWILFLVLSWFILNDTNVQTYVKTHMQFNICQKSCYVIGNQTYSKTVKRYCNLKEGWRLS